MEFHDKSKLISEVSPVSSLQPDVPPNNLREGEVKPIVDYLDIAAKVKQRPTKYVKRVKYRKAPKKAWWKLILRLLFSHLGLFLLVCGYAAFGAYLMIHIELPNEENRKEMKMTRALEVNDTINYLSDVFWYWQDKNYTHDQWVQKVAEMLKGLDHFVVESVADYKYDGEYATWEYDWTFAKSLLYAVSIMSTIGYGHITPKTEFGMIFTVIYALFGIPLLFLFLATIGDVLAKSFKFGYSRICCRWCRSRRKVSEYRKGDENVIVPRDYMRLAKEKVGPEDYMPSNEMYVPIILNLLLIGIYIIFGSLLFSYWESWSFTVSSYFTFITISTIGLGDYVPGRSFLTYSNSFEASLRMLFTCFYCAFGMAIISMSITLMQEQIKAKIIWVAIEIGMMKTPEEIKKEEEEMLLATANIK